jgi:hypothetical protein
MMLSEFTKAASDTGENDASIRPTKIKDAYCELAVTGFS